MLRKKSVHREFIVTNSHETHSCSSQHTRGMLQLHENSSFPCGPQRLHPAVFNAMHCYVRIAWLYAEVNPGAIHASRAPESDWRGSSRRSLFPPIDDSLQLPTKTGNFKAVFQCFTRVRSTESSEFMERTMGIDPRPKLGKSLRIFIPFSSHVMQPAQCES